MRTEKQIFILVFEQVGKVSRFDYLFFTSVPGVGVDVKRLVVSHIANAIDTRLKW